MRFCFEVITFVHIAAFVVYTIMAAMVFRKKMRDITSIRFFIFFVFLAGISLDKIFIHNTCVDIETAYVVYRLSAFFWVALPPLAVLIVLGISERERLAVNPFLITGLAVYTVFMTILHIYPGIHELKPVEFGFSAVEKGFWGLVYYYADWVMIWVVVFLLGLTAITAENRQKRDQSRIILIFSIIGIILMFVMVKARMIWFLAGSPDVLMLFAAIGIVIAMKYYGLMESSGKEPENK